MEKCLGAITNRKCDKIIWTIDFALKFSTYEVLNPNFGIRADFNFITLNC